MFLRLFKGYQAFLLILIPIVGILLWFNCFFINEFELDGRYVLMPFAKMFYNLFGFNTFVSKLFAFSILLLNSLMLVRLNIAYNFLRARTYLPAVIYIILMSFVNDIQRLTPALMASAFVILAIDKVMSTFKKEKLAIQIMDASLLISVASLFYFPAFFLIVYIWIGLILIRPFKWREWAFTILGMTVPYLIIGCIYYISGREITFSLSRLINIPFIIDWEIGKTNISITYFILIGLIILLASGQILLLFNTKKIHSRRFFIYFLWLFLFTIVIYLLIPSTSIEIMYINAIPLSFLFTHYFLNLHSNTFAEILFFILFALVIANKIFLI